MPTRVGTVSPDRERLFIILGLYDGDAAEVGSPPKLLSQILFEPKHSILGHRLKTIVAQHISQRLVSCSVHHSRPGRSNSRCDGGDNAAVRRTSPRASQA